MPNPRRLPILGLVIAALCGGCGKVPVEAPEDLGELTRYLFRNYESETGEELVAGLAQLETYLIDLDLQGDIDDRSVTPPILEPEDLEGLTIPEGVALEEQIPVAVSGLSIWPMAEHRGLIVEPNQVCIANNSTRYHHREFLTDPGCFAAGTCDRLDTGNEIRFENFLAKIWLDEPTNYRTLEAEDGRPTMISRYWIEEQFWSDNGLTSWDQRYTISVWIPPQDDPEKIMRFVSFWSSASMPGVSSDIYAPLVKNGLDEGYVNSDNFAAGIDCDNDRDREYDRPQE